jgi:fibronectin-binding autotransporter adhesin
MLRGLTIIGESISFARRLRRVTRISHSYSPLVFGMALVLSAWVFDVGRAATVTHTADDGFGANGFDGTSNWSDNLAPAAGNDYITQGRDIRTASDANSHTFLGDSLTITDGGRILTKNTASPVTFTVNNLILDAGYFRNAGAGIYNLAGTIHLTTNGGIITGSNFSAGANIQANVDGPGPLAVGGDDSANGGLSTVPYPQANIISGTNTYTGPTLLMGGTVQLASAGALPVGTVLQLGSVGQLIGTTNNGSNVILDLNGQSPTVGGLSVAGANYASVTANSTAVLTGGGKVLARFASLPAGIQIGQRVTRGGSVDEVMGIDYTLNDVLLGENGGINSSGSFTFATNAPPGGRQVVTNNSATPVTLTFAGGSTPSTFSGVITQGATAGATSLTVASGSLTLNGSSTYSGGTTVSGGTLSLDFSATALSTNVAWTIGTSGTNPNTISLANLPNDRKVMFTANAPGGLTLNTPYYIVNSGATGTTFQVSATPGGAPITLTNSGTTASLNLLFADIVNSTTNSSALNLNGGTLRVLGSAIAANSQQFNGLNANGSGAIKLLTNATPQPLSINVGSITRDGTTHPGTIDVTNPSGTLSATNGVQTTTGTAGALITDLSGAAFVTVAGVDWGIKDPTNAFIDKLGSYTPSTGSSLAGNADVVGNVNLSGTVPTSTIRFNSGAQTVSGSTLSTGGILMTANAGASAINGGTLEGTSGTGANLTLIQYNTNSSLSIGSVIADNGSQMVLNKTGAGTAILSAANTYTGATNVLGGTLQFKKESSLPNLGLAGLTVSNGATLALNVGGTNEFTPFDVGTIAGLGFQSGSTLALDTSNASGTVTLLNPLTGSLGVTKQGPGTLVLVQGNTYAGNTTVSGGVVMLDTGATLASKSVSLSAGATFNVNSNSITLKSLNGAAGGTVSMGSGNLTLDGGASSTFSGSLMGTGGLNINGNSSLTLNGTPAYTGSTTITTGTLSLSSTGSTSVGSATSNITIAPNAAGLRDIGTLSVGSGIALSADTILVGSIDTSATKGGIGTLNLTGGSISANTLFLGGAGVVNGFATIVNPAKGTLNLSGGMLTVPAITTNSGGTAGVVNFNGGTLRASTTPTTFVDPGIATRVQAGGAVIDTNGNAFVMSNNFVHDATGPAIDGGLTKTGAGSLTISGTSTYTGPTTVNSGTLVVSVATNTASGYAVNGGGTTLDLSSLGPFSLAIGQKLQGTGTVVASSISHKSSTTIDPGVSGVPNSTGTLTFSNSVGGNFDLAGGTAHFDLSDTSGGANDKVLANGGLTATSPSIIDVHFNTLPSGAQTYTLIQYSGSAIPGSQQPNFVLSSNGGRNLFLDLSTAGQVKLQFNGVSPSGNLTWKSTTSGSGQFWDLASPSIPAQGTANWNNPALGGSGPNDKFFNGDAVTFDDSAGVQTSIIIPDTISVIPSSITVNSSTNNFSIASNGANTGKISTPGVLTKSGTSALTIATSNDYPGGTVINGGKIIALDVGSTAPSSATGTAQVTVGASGTLQIGDGATAGAGSVTGPVHNSGSVVVNRNDIATFATKIDGTGTFTVLGGGTVQPSAVLTYSGNTIITNGTLMPVVANVLSTTSTISLANSATATLDISNNTPAASNQTIPALTGGGTTGGTVNLGANVLTIAGIGSANNTFVGTFGTGTNGSLIVTGSTSATQKFTGTLNYTGFTDIDNGIVQFIPAAPATGIIANATNFRVAPNNNQTATVTIGPNMTVNAGQVLVACDAPGGGQGGTGTVNQTGGVVNAASSIFGGQGAATYNLSGGTYNANGTLQMSINGFAQSGATAVINVSATGQLNLNTNINIQMGAFFGRPATINQTGGTVAFYQDGAATLGGTGSIQINTGGVATYTLAGGLLQANNISFGPNVTGASPPTATGVFNFNGGTLQTVSGGSFFTGTVTNPLTESFESFVGTGGAKVDVFGQFQNLNFPILHNATITGNDGGFTLGDTSASALGNLTLSGENSYNGGTTINKGTLATGALAELARSAVTSGTTNGSRTVTITDTTGLVVGQPVTGTGIPANTVINSITPNTNIILTNAATATNAAASLSFGAVSSVGTGTITINTGGTLQISTSNSIGVANQSAVSPNLTLAGGTLVTPSTNETFGKLLTNATSNIDMQTSAAVLQFNDSTSLHWAPGTSTTGATLHIAGWFGNTSGGGASQILFPSTSSLNPNQLSQIHFDTPSGFDHAKLISVAGGAELVPSNDVLVTLALGNVDQSTTPPVTNVGDIGAMMNALKDLTGYTNSLPAFTGWTPAQATVALADVSRDNTVNNRDVQALIVYLANGGTGFNSPGGGSLTPVPEPSTFVLLALGGLIVCGRVYRRRRSA